MQQIEYTRHLLTLATYWAVAFWAWFETAPRMFLHVRHRRRR